MHPLTKQDLKFALYLKAEDTVKAGTYIDIGDLYTP